jgi:hypothetical protein
VSQFKYLEKAVTIENLIQEEIKRRSNSVNACYYSVQNLPVFSVAVKNLKTRICKTIILHVDLYGAKPDPLRLREEQRLRLFEKKVLRRIFEPKRGEVTRRGGETAIMSSFVICTLRQV